MPVQKEYTPLPGTRFTPMRVEVPTWEDVPANSRTELLRHTISQDSVVDVEYVGADPLADVSMQVSATQNTQSGERTNQEEVTTQALASFGHPGKGGPTATTQLRWLVNNESGTDYTQASTNDVFRSYLNYTIKPMTVLDKLRAGIPLNDPENQLRRDLTLDKYLRMNLIPEQDPFYQPNLEGKSVITDATTTDVLDIPDTGATNAVEVVDFAPNPNEVIYIEGISVNGQDYAVEDNLTLSFVRDTNTEFYRLPTYGMPGDAYQADVHIPVLNRLSISAYAASALTDVEVRVQFARVNKTLLEKALYGLESEVRANDQLGDARYAAYDRFRDLLRAGVPVTPNIDATIENAGVLEVLEETEWSYGRV